MASESSVSCQESTSMPTMVENAMVKLETIEAAVSVTTDCTPPMSLEMRDWISPVRVSVKNLSGMCCR